MSEDSLSLALMSDRQLIKLKEHLKPIAFAELVQRRAEVHKAFLAVELVERAAMYDMEMGDRDRHHSGPAHIRWVP